MRTIGLLPLISLCLLAEAPLPMTASIQRVRLHPDEAWVTRVGRVRLPEAGTHSIRLEALPPSLRLEDLQVAAKGPAGMRLGDLAITSDVRLVTETAEWKRLEAEREALREKRDGLEALGEAAQQELLFLKNLQASHDKELSARMTYATPTATTILELGKNLQARMADLLTGERKRKRDLEKLAQEDLKLAAEMKKRANERRSAPSRVTVELTTAQAGEAEVELSYRTRGARWKPLYEARLSDDRSRLDLVLFASVTQTTGESWDGVRLEISNARPSRSLAVPSFTQGQTVNWFKLAPGVVGGGVGGSGMIVVPEQAMRQNYMSENLAPPPPPPPAPSQAEESAASVIEEASGLAATFLVDGRKDVPSDGEPHRFKVQARELAPQLTLFASPRLDPTAYLMARFAAPSGLPLFPGRRCCVLRAINGWAKLPWWCPPQANPSLWALAPTNPCGWHSRKSIGNRRKWAPSPRNGNGPCGSASNWPTTGQNRSISKCRIES
ncbi:MAG: mucoidy inhibitor MuiA family protein [Holophaga sp.]|nr:mucoidy inhibitor MuiA family protein [Holophaga sp.]